MKAPIILALISALVAAPLFADTVTMKSGEIYVGEIIERTDEYIKLKTDSEVLRIFMSDIAKMATREMQVEYIEPEEIPSAKAKGGMAAEATVSRGRWFITGCLLNLIGVLAASQAEAGPPESYLVGKPSEYIAAFTDGYKEKAKSIQTTSAVTGCIVGTVFGVASCAAVNWCEYQTEKDVAEDCGGEPPPEPGCLDLLAPPECCGGPE